MNLDNPTPEELGRAVHRASLETLKWKRRADISLAVIAVISFLFLCLIAFTVYREVTKVSDKFERNADQIELIHQSQINTCEASKRKGGVRFIVADQIRKQMAQGKELNYHELFPEFPEHQLKTLIKESRKQQKDEVKQLLNVDCNTIYPKITSP